MIFNGYFRGKRVLSAVLLLFFALSVCVVPAGTGMAQASSPAAPSPATGAGETPFSINPLSDFYRLWREQSQPRALEMTAALALADTAEALRLSLKLSEHLIALSEIGVSVCRLFGDEASGYSGIVEGAAAGEGTLGAPDAGVYPFTFTYQDGRRLEGSYRANERVQFSFGEYALEGASGGSSTPPPFSTSFVFVAQDSHEIEKTEQGWTSSVERDNVDSSFAFTANELVFIYGNTQARLIGGVLELGPAPTAAPTTPAQ